MTVSQDPEGHEITALLESVPDWRGFSVLEIGCGDGRLTFRYADLPARVEAIDPDADDIAAARLALPAHLAERVRFQAVSLEDYQPAPGTAPFDLALFSWSL